MSTGARNTHGVSLAISKPGAGRVVTVTLSGAVPGGPVPGGPVYLQLPIFLSVGVISLTGGSYDAATHTVTANPGVTQLTVTLAS